MLAPLAVTQQAVFPPPSLVSVPVWNGLFLCGPEQARGPHTAAFDTPSGCQI